MKLFKLLPCLLVCVLAFSACSDDDDDDKKPDIRTFPSDGITLTLGMDQLRVGEDNGSVYSHYFKYDYTLDYYLNYDTYYNKGNFWQEVLNEEYKNYFPQTGISTGNSEFIGDYHVFNELEVAVSLKREYSNDIEAIKEEISKNPLKVKIKWVAK